MFLGWLFVQSGWSCCTHSQNADAQLSFPFWPRIPSHGIALPSFWICLPMSMKALDTCFQPCPEASHQGDPVKLTTWPFRVFYVSLALSALPFSAPQELPCNCLVLQNSRDIRGDDHPRSHLLFWSLDAYSLSLEGNGFRYLFFFWFLIFAAASVMSQSN